MVNNIKNLENQEFIEQCSTMNRVMSVFCNFSLMGYNSQVSDMHYMSGRGYYECTVWVESYQEAGEVEKQIKRNYMQDGDTIESVYLEKSKAWYVIYKAQF